MAPLPSLFWKSLMAQFARPDSDIAAASWSTAPLWSKVDDDLVASPSGDGVEITSNAVGNNTDTAVAELGLADVGDPFVSTGHVLRVRWRNSGTQALHRNCALVQGSTVIATLTASSQTSTAEAESTLTLSAGEADAITDYSDLRVRLWGRGAAGGSARSLVVEAVELELPDAGSSFPHTVSPSDGVAAAESLTRSRGLSLVIEDTAGSGDALGREADFARAVADMVAGADAADAQLGGAPAPTFHRQIMVVL